MTEIAQTLEILFALKVYKISSSKSQIAQFMVFQESQSSQHQTASRTSLVSNLQLKSGNYKLSLSPLVHMGSKCLSSCGISNFNFHEPDLVDKHVKRCAGAWSWTAFFFQVQLGGVHVHPSIHMPFLTLQHSHLKIYFTLQNDLFYLFYIYYYKYDFYKFILGNVSGGLKPFVSEFFFNYRKIKKLINILTVFFFNFS